MATSKAARPVWGAFCIVLAFAAPAAAHAAATDAPVAQQAPPKRAPVQRSLDAAQVFKLAERARLHGRYKDAAALYDVLSEDARLPIRTEARFRKAMMFVALGRDLEAAETLRKLLDQNPAATRARLELAALLARMNDEAGARRQFREAQAEGLPASVALAVDQFTRSLRSSKAFGGSVEIGLAPNTNINQATSAKTLDTVFVPVNLDKNAQAQAGLGVRLQSQAFGRLRINDTVALLTEASEDANIYGDATFNDIAVNIASGPEVAVGPDRLRPAVGLTRRFFGTHLYSDTETLSFNWLHPIGRLTQVDASVAGGEIDYAVNKLQNGAYVNGQLSVERALGKQAGFGVTLSVQRQDAKDPGYALTFGAVGAFGWLERGGATFFSTASVQALGADARLFPFTRVREDQQYRIAVGAILRQFTVKGFAPVVRLEQTWNPSTVGLYDFDRTSVEFGVTRAI